MGFVVAWVGLFMFSVFFIVEWVLFGLYLERVPIEYVYLLEL